MTVCSHCGFPDPQNQPHCPQCGTARQLSAETVPVPQGGGWGKAVVGSEEQPQQVGRPRFGESDDFYQPLKPRAAGNVNETVPVPSAVEGGATVITRRSGPPLAFLVERTGGTAGKVHRLAEQNGIGRSRRTGENSIVIGDDTVSRRHGRVSYEQSRFYYTDLDSSNGSFVVEPQGNRTRLTRFEPFVLQDGVTIELGDVQLTYIEIE